MKAVLDIVKIDFEDVITTSDGGGLENVGTGGNTSGGNTGSGTGTPVFPTSLLD